MTERQADKDILRQTAAGSDKYTDMLRDRMRVTHTQKHAQADNRALKIRQTKRLQQETEN